MNQAEAKFEQTKALHANRVEHSLIMAVLHGYSTHNMRLISHVAKPGADLRTVIKNKDGTDIAVITTPAE